MLLPLFFHLCVYTGSFITAPNDMRRKLHDTCIEHRSNRGNRREKNNETSFILYYQKSIICLLVVYYTILPVLSSIPFNSEPYVCRQTCEPFDLIMLHGPPNIGQICYGFLRCNIPCWLHQYVRCKVHLRNVKY